ncbi:MAG: hypothetical protein KC431_00105, partial [Myxococcales bacterium]|nr:hypothetical protein [Myxococcales bacterium]
QLSRRQVIEEAGSGRLRFTHDKLREAAYAGIETARRVLAHRRLAEVISSTTDGEPGLETVAALGYHWSAALEHERAWPMLRRAAELSVGIHAHGPAINYLRAALLELGALGFDPHLPPAVELREALGDALEADGHYPEAAREFTALYQQSREQNPVARARSLRKRGRALDVLFHNNDALDCYQEASALLDTVPSSAHTRDWISERIEVRTEILVTTYFLADIDANLFDVEEFRREVDRYGTPLQLARAYNALWSHRLRMERYALSDETVDMARTVLASAEDSGDEREITDGLFVVAFAKVLHDEFTAAERFFHRTIARARECGDHKLEMRALTYLTMTHRRRRDTDRVEQFGRASLEVSTRIGIPTYIAAARAQLGWVEWTRGNSERAFALLTAAIDSWVERVMAWPFQWLADLPLMALEFERGDLEAAADVTESLLADRAQALPEALTSALRFLRGTERADPRLSSRIAAVLEQARLHSYL